VTTGKSQQDSVAVLLWKRAFPVSWLKLFCHEILSFPLSSLHASPSFRSPIFRRAPFFSIRETPGFRVGEKMKQGVEALPTI
jgi:hypothetical protein